MTFESTNDSRRTVQKLKRPKQPDVRHSSFFAIGEHARPEGFSPVPPMKASQCSARPPLPAAASPPIRQRDDGQRPRPRQGGPQGVRLGDAGLVQDRHLAPGDGAHHRRARAPVQDAAGQVAPHSGTWRRSVPHDNTQIHLYDEERDVARTRPCPPPLETLPRLVRRVSSRRSILDDVSSTCRAIAFRFGRAASPSVRGARSARGAPAPPPAAPSESNMTRVEAKRRRRPPAVARLTSRRQLCFLRLRG